MFLINSFEVVVSKKRVNQIVTTLVLTILVNIVLQVSIYFFTNSLNLLYLNRLFFDSEYADFSTLHANRGRFFTENLDVVLIPILIYIFISTTTKKKILSTLIMLGVLFMSLVSNYRKLFVVSILSVIASILFTYQLITKKYLTVLISLSTILIIIGSLISQRRYGFNVIDRLLLTEKYDIETITVRFDFWNTAFKMGSGKPLFGVGLGNYYDNNISKQTYFLSIDKQKNELAKATLIHPHNDLFAKFAETGFVGLSAYLILLIYFFISDFRLYTKKTSYNKLLIISFWSIVLLTLVGPKFSLPYTTLFWLLRILIYKIKCY